MWKRGLHAPIIALLALIALSTLLLGHWIGLASLRDSLESREKDRLAGIHSIVKASIEMEAASLASLTHVLSRNPVLQELLTDGKGFDRARHQEIVDDLYRGIRVDVIAVTDARGERLFSSGKREDRVDLSALWGMDEALDGQEVVSIDRGVQGFVIQAISPLYGEGAVKGTILVGNLIDDHFAEKLAGETESRIVFGTEEELIASSVAAEKGWKIDRELVRYSLLDKMPIFTLDRDERTLRLYAPISVIDNHFCLVVESDVSRMHLLVERSRWRMLWASVVVLLLVTALGSLVTIRLTRPLRALRRRAEGVMGAYSPQAAAVDSKGNEVVALVQAFDSMVTVLQDHIAERDRVNEQLERTRAELDERVQERTAELREANEALSRAKDTAEDANRAKSEFLAAMSHELRTPLHQIMGFTELVIDSGHGTLSGKQERYLNLSLQSSRHLLSLINEILDIAKIEAGKVNLQLEEVDLVSLLEESLLMVRDEAMQHNIEISLKIGELPDKIDADGKILRQILHNLLSNATKFTEAGGSIQLSAGSVVWVGSHLLAGDGRRIEPPQKGGGGAREHIEFVEVSVADAGVGLVAEDLERIFTPFEQGHSSLARRFEGTGLGLALVKEFVELHGGRIWAESQGLGRGASFHFVIPVSHPPEQTLKPPGIRTERGRMNRIRRNRVCACGTTDSDPL
jgi:signal transduction histidine kinase/sensor domain CHASE-containing protein